MLGLRRSNFSQYEDSLIWDLYDQIVPLLLDLRRIMFRRNLESINERSIEYFDNVYRMFYSPEKVLDSEMVLISVVRWYTIMTIKCPEYIRVLHEFLEEVTQIDFSSPFVDRPEYLELVGFATDTTLLDEALTNTTNTNYSHHIKNVAQEVIADASERIQEGADTSFLYTPSRSYFWTGNPEDLRELQNQLTFYLAKTSPENFRMVFQGSLSESFVPLVWKRNANELVYLILKMMEMGLLVEESRLDSVKLDTCFLQLNGKQPGRKWRYHKQTIDKMKSENRDRIDSILLNFL
jgi:hypothetical protein